MTYAQSTLDVHVTGRRVVATIIDGILLSLVYSGFTALFGRDNGEHSGSALDFTRLTTGAGLWWFLVALLYYVVLESTLGRTVGKMVTGIRVVKETTGRPPGVGAALVRTLLRIIDGIGGYLLGFIIVLCSKNCRRLGDMGAETLVVRS
jgi:uncharacterized RDD family membrane protein YckC